LIYSIGFDLGAKLVIWSFEPMLLKENSKELSRNKYWVNFKKAITKSPAVT
tara:strand:- start:613 stop:765 length:153 start_codon:yes stop_codon:yes gene_type:complete